MSVITIAITNSDLEIVSGIPRYLTITTNVAATIFYTFDNTTPTTMSDVYVDRLFLPTNQNSVNLRLLATNGVNSTTFYKVYKSSFDNLRSPQDSVTNINNTGALQPDPYPFGDYSPGNSFTYGNTAGTVVDAKDIVGIPDGYDGFGNISNETDQDLSAYQFRYSTTNFNGMTGEFIGNLPGKVSVITDTRNVRQKSSNTNDLFFNPKALVIYQDGTEAPIDPDVPMTNRPFFTLADAERERNGYAFRSTTEEGNILSGAMLRPHYNPRDNTYTFYYRDSVSNRWIISKESVNMSNVKSTALYNILLPSGSNGSRYLYKWILFKSSRLI